MITKKNKDFEDFLMDIYILVENPLDDDIPDGFNDWLFDLEPDDYIIFGNRFCKEQCNKIVDNIK